MKGRRCVGGAGGPGWILEVPESWSEEFILV